MSTTRAISIRDFRENMTKFLREAQEKNVHFVVMRHAEPVAHVAPINSEDASIEALAVKVAQARRDIDEGNTYSTEEVLAMIDHHANRVLRSGKRRSQATSSGQRTKNREKNGMVRRTGQSSLIRKKAH